MNNKKKYHAKVIYSVYMGIIMGFFITSGFLVIITNIDRYFFNGFIGIKGDWLYYIGTILLVPIFGAIYVYNKRIVIQKNILVLRENSFSFNASKMDISLIKNISLYEQGSRKRRKKKGINFTDGEITFMVFIKPFSKNTLSILLRDLLKINSNIIIDDYYKNIMKIN